MSSSPHSATQPPPKGAGKAEAQALAALFAELYNLSGAAKYGLEPGDWVRVLAGIGAKYLPPDAGQPQAIELYRTLRVEELALARGCAAGNEAAWQDFLLRYREKLYDAAGAIAREDSAARELADSLYADLYGTSTRDGERLSKLNFYMGRGSLEGWLRTVLAQEYVNRYRRGKRLVSLEEKEEAGVQFVAPAQEAAATLPIDARLEAATDQALESLAAEDRFILAAYFLDQRTLAEIAQTLGVHESTISRKLGKVTAGLRKQIVSGLRQRGMSKRQAEEALEADVRDFSLDIRGRLQETTARTFSGKKEAR
jgi:RNA polymerase sigma-70 factor (ECF subfamily)